MMYVDLHFPVIGTTIPSDHAYSLYGAISRLLPDAHQSDWLAIETIAGISRGDGCIQLDNRAKLKIRILCERIPFMLKLAGKRLDLDGQSIRLGAPQVYSLNPSSTLYSRIVTIKGYTEPGTFNEAIKRKLTGFGVNGEPIVGERRKVKISNHIIIGFALRIQKLEEEESILLQVKGLGGRRVMGCGIFSPVRKGV